MLLTLKVIFISTSVLSAAVALKLSFPFAVREVPSVYNGVVSWLSPLYLFLLINCIIITILASSKLHSNSNTQPHARHTPPPAVLPPLLEQVEPHSFDDVSRNEEVAAQVAVEYNNFADSNRIEEKSSAEIGKDVNGFNIDDGTVADDASMPEADINGYKDESSISNSSSSTPTATTATISRRDSLKFPDFNEKPPASSRFGHRRSVKASPEGGKAVLGVSRPKRQDTLERAWRVITEGRAIPLTRHLRKSDAHGGRQHPLLAPPNPKMLKYETFSGGGGDNNNTSLLSRSPGGFGKLGRSPSLGKDDLYRRVEAFIKKSNKETRLQRGWSL